MVTYKQLEAAIAAARKYLAEKPENESSARFCLEHAVAHKDKLDNENELLAGPDSYEAVLESAVFWARQSLKYSLGILHPEYRALFPPPVPNPNPNPRFIRRPE